LERIWKELVVEEISRHMPGVAEDHKLAGTSGFRNDI
jgi:hypothetical protein